MWYTMSMNERERIEFAQLSRLTPSKITDEQIERKIKLHEDHMRSLWSTTKTNAALILTETIVEKIKGLEYGLVSCSTALETIEIPTDLIALLSKVEVLLVEISALRSDISCWYRQAMQVQLYMDSRLNLLKNNWITLSTTDGTNSEITAEFETEIEEVLLHKETVDIAVNTFSLLMDDIKQKAQAIHSIALLKSQN